MTEQEMQFELMKSQEKVNALRQEVAAMNKECEYWQHYRIQAAVAAMQAELSNPNNTFMMCEDKRAIIVRRAVGYVDALITELQKKDEMMKPSNGISVTFLKGKDGLWHSYTAYAEDVDYETMVKFSNCIGNAVDALNKKGGEE